MHGTRFWPDCLDSTLPGYTPSPQTQGMIDLCDFVDACRPPDDDLVDLIEQAFLEGQIDRVT